ncbi:hypothetical protein MRX96_030668 [Rhipicephalus microplus]
MYFFRLYTLRLPGHSSTKYSRPVGARGDVATAPSDGGLLGWTAAGGEGGPCRRCQRLSDGPTDCVCRSPVSGKDRASPDSVTFQSTRRWRSRPPSTAPEFPVSTPAHPFQVHILSGTVASRKTRSSTRRAKLVGNSDSAQFPKTPPLSDLTVFAFIFTSTYFFPRTREAGHTIDSIDRAEDTTLDPVAAPGPASHGLVTVAKLDTGPMTLSKMRRDGRASLSWLGGLCLLDHAIYERALILPRSEQLSCSPRLGETAGDVAKESRKQQDGDVAEDAGYRRTLFSATSEKKKARVAFVLATRVAWRRVAGAFLSSAGFPEVGERSLGRAPDATQSAIDAGQRLPLNTQRGRETVRRRCETVDRVAHNGAFFGLIETFV